MRRFAVLLALSVIVFGCSRREDAVETEKYVFAPIVAVSAHIAVVEKPDAARALLIGDDAMALEPYLARAGVKCFFRPDGKYDIVAVACSRMSDRSCERLSRYVSENGIVVWVMDVKGVSAEDFRGRLTNFSFPQAHLWMPGETRWLLVGRKTPRKVKLSAMLDFYSREEAFEDFAFSRCASLQELFGSYIADREAVMPAFERGDLSAEVKPEFFLERSVSNVGWISRDGVDGDIAAEVFAKMRSVQKVRRKVVKGNIASAVGRVVQGGGRSAREAARRRGPVPDRVRQRDARLGVPPRRRLYLARPQQTGLVDHSTGGLHDQSEGEKRMKSIPLLLTTNFPLLKTTRQNNFHLMRASEI